MIGTSKTASEPTQREALEESLRYCLESADLPKAEKILEELWYFDFSQNGHSLLLDTLMGDYVYRKAKDATRWVLEKGEYNKKYPVQALCAYAALGDSKEVKDLLEKGLDPNTPFNPHCSSYSNRDALDFAYMNERIEAMELLLSNRKMNPKRPAELLPKAFRYKLTGTCRTLLKYLKMGDPSIIEAFKDSPDLPEDWLKDLLKKIRDPDIKKLLSENPSEKTQALCNQELKKRMFIEKEVLGGGLQLQ